MAFHRFIRLACTWLALLAAAWGGSAFALNEACHMRCNAQPNYMACYKTCDAGPSGTGGSRFGAIAVSPSSNEFGFSYKLNSRREAEGRAMSECRSSSRRGDCRIATWFRDSCGALAQGGVNTWGAEWGSSGGEASRKAMAVCERGGQRCRVVQTVCAN